MAHQIGSLDKVFRLAGTNKSWHSLEAEIENLTTRSPEFMEHLEKCFCEKIPVLSATGQVIGYELVSRGLGRHHSMVTDRYKISQYDEAPKMVEDLLGEDHPVDFAGTLFDGSMFIMTVSIGDYEVVGGDKMKDYLGISMGHTGKDAVHVFGTETRIVCDNTRRWAVQAAKDDKAGSRYRKIVHKGDMNAKLEAVREAWKDLRQSALAKREEERDLAEAKMTTKAIEKYFGSMVDYIMKLEGKSELDKAELATEQAKIENRPLSLDEMADYTDALKRLGTKRAEADLRQKRRNEAVEYMKLVLERESSILPEATDSKWLVYNAVSNYADHALVYRGEDQASRRLESNLVGRSDSIKAHAYASIIDASELSVGV